MDRALLAALIKAARRRAFCKADRADCNASGGRDVLCLMATALLGKGLAHAGEAARPLLF